MKYIQSEELREWVKENLRKTIFQKAHALAVQTGCEVLVKLQDTRDITGRQYYATHNLQRAYNNNALRKHPAEMLVSGETGLPLVNQATQIGQVSPDDCDVSSLLDNGDSVSDIGAVPTQLTAANQTDDLGDDVQVKMEPMSDEDASSITDVSQDNSTVDGDSGMDFEGFSDNQASSRNLAGSTSVQRYQTSQSQSHLYQCAICQKTFRTINILQMHTQTFHLRGTTMASPTRTLNTRGKGKSGRKSYFRQEQPEQKRFPCSVCERTFHHPDLLKDHVSRSHMGQSMLVSAMKNRQATSTAVTIDTSSPSSSTQSQIAVSSAGSSQNLHQNSPSMSEAPIDGDPLDPQIQMSPVKSLIPTEAFLSNLGNRSSALFCQNMPSTPFKHPGGGSSSRNSTQGSNQGDQPKGPMPTIKIMKAILAIGGPVSTANTVKDNLRNRNYDRVTNELFVEAANQLKDIGLGYLVACKNGSGRLVDVFIKKPPAEVMEILEANSGLCDPAVYVTTFAAATPVRLMRSSQLIENLIASGLVAEEHLKSHCKVDVNNQANDYIASMYDGNMGVVYDGNNVEAMNPPDADVLNQADAGILHPDVGIIDPGVIDPDANIVDPDMQVTNSSDSFSENCAGE